jgi:deoxyribodipyrimidine photo-lyase
MTQDTPDGWLKALLAPFNPSYQAETPLVDAEILPHELKRFSRYWNKIGVKLLA